MDNSLSLPLDQTMPDTKRIIQFSLFWLITPWLQAAGHLLTTSVNHSQPQLIIANLRRHLKLINVSDCFAPIAQWGLIRHSQAK